MAARETHHRSLPVVDFLSADTERDYGESSLQQRLKPPPLSLRTRENSSLALKYIFDQINSSADSAPFNNNSSRAFEKKDNIEMHPLDKDGPSAVFGSPISTQNASDNVNLPVHQGFLPRAVSRISTLHFSTHQTEPNPSSPAIRQPTAQLTIFYSGTVNVYDDVPVDKANAIMLLAGTGNSWSTKPANQGDKERISTQMNSPSPPHVGTLAPVSLAMATPTVTTTTATTTTSRAMGFPMPSAPSMVTNTIISNVSTPPPPSPSPSLPAAPKRSHAGIELPQARKASLARFLEKRRDRVQVKQQQPDAVPQSEEEEKGEMSRDEKPKKPCLSPTTRCSEAR